MLARYCCSLRSVFPVVLGVSPPRAHSRTQPCGWTGWATVLVLFSATGGGLACGSMSAASTRDGGGIRVHSPAAYVHAPLGFPGASHAQEDLGREVLRCYEAELGDNLQWSDPALQLRIAFDGDGGLEVQAVQGPMPSSGRFNNCVSSVVSLWDWTEFPRGDDGQILPLEFGPKQGSEPPTE
jgi:hypothetical protein